MGGVGEIAKSIPGIALGFPQINADQGADTQISV